MPFDGITDIEARCILLSKNSWTWRFISSVTFIVVQKSILLSLKHPQSQQSGGWLPMDGQLSIRTRGMVAIPPKRFVFIQRYRALLFARSSLFCSSNEQIKPRSSMGGIWTGRWLPRETRACFLLHPILWPTTFATELFPFLFHANEIPVFCPRSRIISWF